MGNKPLAKSLTVLDTLIFSSSPLSAAQLSYPLKLTQPTIYRILGTLARPEYVTRDADGPFYRVSYLDAVAGVSRAMGGAAPVRPRPGAM